MRRARISRRRGNSIPTTVTPYALNAIIDVAQNNRRRALDNARRAVSLAPQSVPARLALSYALQASFELEAARDELLQVVARDATGDRPEHALALARLAELWLSLGYVGKAMDAANRAVRIAPRSGARARRARIRRADQGQDVRGEGRVRTGDCARVQQPARAPWSRAGDDPRRRSARRPPRPRDGGRARRRGCGHSQLSRQGLLRGEARRLGAEQFALAKRFDPRDPTPYLYDAIRKQTVNRPVEALQDLQTSIELNDNRAVYRSRFLLDEDLAARGASFGRIYRDVGFEQLALVEGWKSLGVDPGDFSAHRLLADAYLGLPRLTIARDSELLQSQLLQPLNINPVQPRLADNGFPFLDTGIAGLGFNEFTRLFAGNQLRFIGDGLLGDHGTSADNLILSGIYNRLSFSVGQSHTDTDGVRDNNDAEENIYNAFLQAEISPSTSAQVEFRATDVELGDRRMLFDSDNFLSGLRSIADTSSIRVGGRHTFAPGSVTIGSLCPSHARRESRYGGGPQSAD